MHRHTQVFKLLHHKPPPCCEEKNIYSTAIGGEQKDNGYLIIVRIRQTQKIVNVLKGQKMGS